MKKAICRCISALVVFVCILSFAGLCAAVEFSSDVVNNQMGMEIKGKIYVKGDKVRMEMSPPGGGSSITIMDTKSGEAYVLMPETKTYMVLSAAQAESTMQQFNTGKEMDSVASTTIVGQETVNGYVCDKYEVVYHDKTMGKATNWISQELHYPIKIVYDGPHGVMTSEYMNIKTGGVSDSLFEIPADYQEMSMPKMGNFMNMMGGGGGKSVGMSMEGDEEEEAEAGATPNISDLLDVFKR